MEVLSEKPVLPHEVKKHLENVSKKYEMSYIEDKTLKYLKEIPLIDTKDAEELLESLKSLDYPELSPNVLIKIVEFLPEDIDDLRVILYGLSLDKEKANKIIELVRRYK